MKLGLENLVVFCTEGEERKIRYRWSYGTATQLVKLKTAYLMFRFFPYPKALSLASRKC